jgi:1,4-alpha-glucan branching enzyme
MLERHPDPASGKVRVTFRLPAAAGATVAWVAGEWNDWSHLADQMEATADGTLECNVILEPGRSYRFRYYLGADRWENDWNADSYVDNEFGGADSVVTLAATESSGRPNGGRVESVPSPRRIRVDDLG